MKVLGRVGLNFQKGGRAGAHPVWREIAKPLFVESFVNNNATVEEGLLMLQTPDQYSNGSWIGPEQFEKLTGFVSIHDLLFTLSMS